MLNNQRNKQKQNEKQTSELHEGRLSLHHVFYVGNAQCARMLNEKTRQNTHNKLVFVFET